MSACLFRFNQVFDLVEAEHVSAMIVLHESLVDTARRETNSAVQAMNAEQVESALAYKHWKASSIAFAAGKTIRKPRKIHWPFPEGRHEQAGC